MRRRDKLVGVKIVTNRILFILFYIAIFFGIGIGGYFIYLSFFDFYFENEEIDAEVGEKKSSGLITKRDFEIGDGDYIYTIADQSVARVDKHGNIIGVSEGVTELEFKYKHSLTSKKIRVVISDDYESEDEDDKEEESINDLTLPY